MRISIEMNDTEKATVGGAVGFGAIGGVVGSHMGIAALGTAIVGTIPIAIVGAVVGGLVINKFAPALLGRWSRQAE